MEIKELKLKSGELWLAATHWNPNPALPMLLLVHGYPDNSRVWDRVVAQLSNRYQIVTYDVRGAGQSSRPKSIADYSLESLVADMQQVVQTVDNGADIHLVGHDWGAIQSWEAIAASPLEERFASFTSISGPCLDHIGFWLQKQLKARSLNSLLPVAGQLSRSWYMAAFQLPLLGSTVWRAGLGKAWPQLVKQLEGVLPNSNQHRKDDGIAGINLYRRNLLPRLIRPQERRSHLPIQIVRCKQDPFLHQQLIDEAQQWCSNLSELAIDSGHWAPLSAAEALADGIHQFVSTHV